MLTQTFEKCEAKFYPLFNLSQYPHEAIIKGVRAWLRPRLLATVIEASFMARLA